MVTTVSSAQVAAFPAAQVEACIRNVLADQAADQAILRPHPPTTTPGIVPGASWEPEVDSLVAVEIICVVEEILGLKLPATFSPRGGYDTAEACVNDLMSQAQVAWEQSTTETQNHVQ
ncbi:acyl carrier protein [Bradyrhizobium sp. BWA-3-5]|uniref:acyl carrier protein n=1 Tax=Bradyrhizobium sp. BWA-3-5 TaxID=3080013 RepID=UPI00293E4508|nr:acyl carrier protein [Bradyrhizobium sp. BWA-3-5]WOH63696.1 acyl carrier protein [Bradyrhizobium sp. BWA-3-5]